VPTLQTILPCVIPLSTTIEIEHPQRVSGALGVPLHNGMPAAAMWAPKQSANSEWALHVRSMCNLRDNAGQRRFSLAGDNAHGIVSGQGITVSAVSGSGQSPSGSSPSGRTCPVVCFVKRRSSAMMSLQTSTHSLQMNTLFAPAISFFTSCCPLLQNEQRSTRSTPFGSMRSVRFRHHITFYRLTKRMVE